MGNRHAIGTPLVAIEDLLEHADGIAPLPAVISFIGMIENPRKQLDMLAPIAAVKRVIGDQHFHVGGVCQRLKLLADHPGTQQKKESMLIGMDRIEKPIHRVLAHTTAYACFKCAEKVLSGEYQGEQNLEHSDGRNVLLAEVAEL